MIEEGLNLSRFVVGEARPYRVWPGAAITTMRHMDTKAIAAWRLNGMWLPAGTWEHNDVMYDAATVFAELLRGEPDGKQYRVGAVYFEFENNGGAPVSPPSFERDGGKSYYDGLLTDSYKDYIRVALTAATMDATDEDNYPRGNRLTFFAQTEGVIGVHGKTFSDTVSSRVFGGALVATPEFSDDTQDLVVSRFYFSDSDNQLIKLAGSQIGLTWRFKLL